ncbi:putative GTP pyrophosphokinase [Lactobacillus bombicola]|uniref:GTP pyrophosphokinase family protein n=1 Tax=Lactobacillus bombicola TaxID=1505723 RepID=A0A1I1SEP3_9LACO|nr:MULTISPECIES: GTP pyrophosphokinase family protein [Lactobacillus]MCO6527723.1 GTP pyrophosphokinase family protein [Lactobacillus sp.]RHW49054.1 GTP pyrophosphokinase family protein [Lactobacillus bombicola]RHW53495.1 GTP pyrophosphokinase family protein [Lactobacillus bombicola]RHW54330.1 GTP pyrophosphokinase family protein [Lactobacillus bombicola]RMC42172.1 GTP pyrophosphokinase family protein [Lactobacillus sp. ESL0233]
MNIDWENFLWPYDEAVRELKIKFRSLRQSFLTEREHSPIEFVVGRVKSVDSIKEKMQRRVISPEVIETDMQDIAGIRIVCQFVDDIYKVVDLIHARDDMEVVEERDYVKNAKSSGYRSYHMVISYTIYLPEGSKKLLAEIQIRTLAMNFWATVEHTLNYKYQGSYPKDISKRLKSTAETAYKLDEEMSLIKDEVQEAQKVFTKNKGKEN